MLSTAAARSAALAPRTVAVRAGRRSVAVRACESGLWEVLAARSVVLATS